MRLFVITSQYTLVCLGVHDFFSFVKSFAGFFFVKLHTLPTPFKNIMVYPDKLAQAIL